MKLIRFGNAESERPGVFLDGKRKDLSQYFRDWDRSFFREGGLKKLHDLPGNLLQHQQCINRVPVAIIIGTLNQFPDNEANPAHTGAKWQE